MEKRDDSPLTGRLFNGKGPKEEVDGVVLVFETKSKMKFTISMLDESPWFPPSPPSIGIFTHH